MNNTNEKSAHFRERIFRLVETAGLEPVTPCMQARLTALRYDFYSIFLAFNNHYFGFSSKLLIHKRRTNKPITV